MHPITGEFNFTRLETVIYGPGKISTLWRELSKRNQISVGGLVLAREPWLRLNRSE